MARLLLSACLAAMLLVPAAARARAERMPHNAGPASAHRVSVQRTGAAGLAAGDLADLAATLAERYWGAVPCGGQVVVRADQPLAAGMQASTDGWVTFESSLGANDLLAPAETYTQCTISLARWQWPTRALQASDWNMLCLTVVHEMGHLLGHPHSLARSSVMAAVFTDEANVPAVCRHARAQVQASAGRT